MTTAELAGDDAARAAVVEDLDSTLFLEAGAGSGKTSCLVARFVALVESGVAADNIAAITFTEKAAAELVDRIRSELQQRAEANPRCREGLRVLDSAAIGTLHSFAQRILSEHPDRGGPSSALHGQRRDCLAGGIRHSLGAVCRRDARRPRPGDAAAAAVGQRGEAQASARRGGRLQLQLGSRRRAH